MYYWNLNRPNPSQNRQAWNTSWETDISRNYSSLHPIVPVFRLYESPEIIGMFDSMLHSHLAVHTQRTREICELQTDLVALALEALLEHDFEVRWVALSNDQRSKFILEGLYRTSVKVIAGMEPWRKYCPELVVRDLVMDAGRPFIRLLKRFLDLAGTDSIDDVVHVPHPATERLFDTKGATSSGALAQVKMNRLKRMMFLTFTLFNTLLAFLNREDQILVGKAMREAPGSRVHDKFGSSEYAHAKSALKKELRARGQSQFNFCSSCKELEQPEENFRRCKLCYEECGITILYCGRECQVHDWRKGVPLPHKLVCGKAGAKTQIANLKSNAPIPKPVPSDAEALIPPPLPSFKPTLALSQQIFRLKDKTVPKEIDYYINDLGLALDAGRKDFLVMRRRAFRTGDSNAVLVMRHLLTMYATSSGRVAPVDFTRVLRAEYRQELPVDAVFNAELPTDEEKDLVERSGIARSQSWLPSYILSSEIKDPSDLLPLPISPFTHTTALKRQLALLRLPPCVQYVLMKPTPAPDIALQLLNHGKVFLVMRRRALKTGDIRAIKCMFYLLCTQCSQTRGFSHDELQRQFKAEWNVDVTMEPTGADFETESSSSRPTCDEMKIIEWAEGMKSDEEHLSDLAGEMVRRILQRNPSWL